MGRCPPHCLTWAFGLLLLALVAFNTWYFVIRRGLTPATVVERLGQGRVDHILDDPMWRSAAEQYERLNRRIGRRPVALFLGDSITKGFPLEEYFPPVGDSLLVLNRGINSDTVLGLEARLERNVLNLDVRRLFFMTGTNDLLYRSPEETARRVEALLQKIPAPMIVVQSILPSPVGRKGVHERARAYNRLLEEMCRRHGYIYLDLFEHFAGPGDEMKPDYSADGVHPNGSGYELWKDLVAPQLGR